MTISHNDDIPEDRQAIAPYNFVPLPPKVVPAEKPPSQDRYHEHRKTGRIVCTLTTGSPLFVRCGLTPTQFATLGTKRLSEMSLEEQQQYAQFFSTERTDDATGAPVIPGSSLRGMLRTLVEIVGYGKLTRVTDQQRYTFRAVAASKDDPLALPYRQLLKNVQAGYLIQKDNGWFIQPATTINTYTFLKVRECDIPNSLGITQFNDPQYRPQYQQVSFTYRSTKNGRTVVDQIDKCGVHTHQGTLVTSGNMLETNSGGRSPRKNHCVVLERSQDSLIPIDDMAIEDYVLALTDFQKESPFDTKWGILKHGRPVFYCKPEKNRPVTFFGQSPNFRIPYRPSRHPRAASPLDFVPSNLQSSEGHDLAEAIFGYVQKEQQSQDQACAGRVFVGDAVLAPSQEPEDVWLSAEPFAPHILASPKPTTFQHYLVQPDSESDKKNLKHYASTPETETTIRGHKRYWHRGSVTETMLRDHAFYHETPNQQQSDTQHTRLKPVKDKVTFHFDIHFENLSAVELGALLWVLNHASGEHRLSLGMGKSLGMGAIEISYEVEESLRKQRYTSVFAEEAWANPTTTLSEDRKTDYIKQFSDYVLNESGEGKQVSNLEETTRIRCLLAMLRWPGLSQSQTRYMEIERSRTSQPIQAARCRGDRCNEYAERPVLPGPLQIVGEMPSYQHHHASNADEESSTLEPIQVTPDQHGVIETLATDDQFGYVEDTDGKRYTYLITDVDTDVSLKLHQRVMFRVEKRKIAVGNGKKRREKWQSCAVEIHPHTK